MAQSVFTSFLCADPIVDDAIEVLYHLAFCGGTVPSQLARAIVVAHDGVHIATHLSFVLRRLSYLIRRLFAAVDVLRAVEPDLRATIIGDLFGEQGLPSITRACINTFRSPNATRNLRTRENVYIAGRSAMHVTLALATESPDIKRTHHKAAG